MKQIVLCIGSLIISFSSLLGQCNFNENLKVDRDLTDCLPIIESMLEDDSIEDTLLLKLTYYKILSDEMSLDELSEAIGFCLDLKRKLYSQRDDKSIRDFLKTNYYQFRYCKIIALELAYNKSIAINDFLNASYFAGRLRREIRSKNKTSKSKEEWANLELIQYQKHAGENYLELLKFHSHMLMKNTSYSLKRLDSLGFDYLVQLIDKVDGRGQFEQKLNRAIELSYLVEKPNDSVETELFFGGLSSYYLRFKFEGCEFEFLDRRISKLYHYDAIYEIPTISYVWGENGCQEVHGIVIDTIENQIDNFLEIEEYKSSLKETYFYEIARRINE